MKTSAEKFNGLMVTSKEESSEVTVLLYNEKGLQAISEGGFGKKD